MLVWGRDDWDEAQPDTNQLQSSEPIEDSLTCLVTQVCSFAEPSNRSINQMIEIENRNHQHISTHFSNKLFDFRFSVLSTVDSLINWSYVLKVISIAIQYYIRSSYTIILQPHFHAS
jgi:hypothetical protein